MDYILYNNDGSIKLTNFTEFINKGSNNVNKIFVGLTKDSTVDLSTYDVYAVFKLPNGQAEPVIGTLVSGGKEIEEINETWYGYEILLGQDVTCFAGLVKCTIRVEKNDEILYTYPVVLTVNDTAISPADLTLANLQQYENLKTYVYGLINSLPYVTTNTDQYITAPKTFTTGIVFKHANTAKYGIDVNEEGESLRFAVWRSPDDFYAPLEIAYDRVWTTVPLYANGEFSLHNSAGDYGEYCGFYYTDNNHLCMYWAPYNEQMEEYQRKDYYFPNKTGTLALLDDCGSKLYAHEMSIVHSTGSFKVSFVSNRSTAITVNNYLTELPLTEGKIILHPFENIITTGISLYYVPLQPTVIIIHNYEFENSSKVSYRLNDYSITEIVDNVTEL